MFEELLLLAAHVAQQTARRVFLGIRAEMKNRRLLQSRGDLGIHGKRENRMLFKRSLLFPFVAFGLICVGLFGKAVMLAWLGGRIAGRSGVGAIGHPAVAVLIGGVLVLILYVVPVLGFLVYKVLGFLGLGAVVYTVILDSQAIRAAKSAPASASPQTAA